ncbi:YraN family protein [Alicyclobacillus sendaiensis]|uniref:YraN family protein n=1 Tax=Alicyclobacillus sendaiensis TaxID=192387 RepID=UPI0034CE1B15
MKPNRRELGTLGEAFVRQYLERCLGWRVVDSNWKTRFGELDLVAEHEGELVAVEVKTRTSPVDGDPIYALGSVQIPRLVAALMAYAARIDGWASLALDVVGITWKDGIVVGFRHERLYPQ